MQIDRCGVDVTALRARRLKKKAPPVRGRSDGTIIGRFTSSQRASRASSSLKKKGKNDRGTSEKKKTSCIELRRSQLTMISEGGERRTELDEAGAQRLIVILGGWDVPGGKTGPGREGQTASSGSPDKVVSTGREKGKSFQMKGEAKSTYGMREVDKHRDTVNKREGRSVLKGIQVQGKLRTPFTWETGDQKV